MANKGLKGITYEINGNATGLQNALKGVNTATRDLSSELNSVNRLLKLDPSNTTLLKQKQDLLNKSISETKDKLNTLKSAQSQVNEQFKSGKIGEEQYRSFQREIQSTEEKLKSLDKQAGSMSGLNQMANKLGLSANNVKTAVGTVGIAVSGFLKSSIEDAAEAGNAQANLEQTVKSTGKAAGMSAQQMEELAQKEQDTSTFSLDAVESGEAMLATFTNIGKDVFPQATQAVLDFAQKMGTDPKAAALTLGKALNDPATGLSKLTKSGVAFTAQQQEQIKAMEKAGNTAGAQKLMIAELNKEFGGQAAAAASTYSGKQKQLANDLKEVKESIGNALIPIITQLGGYLVKIIQPIAEFISQNPKLSAGILAVIAVVSTLIGGLSVLNTVTAAFGITLDAALLPTIGLVVAAIAGIVVAATLIIKNWSSISSFFVGVWNNIKNAFSGVGDWFKSTFESAKSGVQSVWSNAGSWFSSAGNSIKNVFDTTIELIKQNWKSLALFLVNPIVGAVSLLYNNNPKFKAWADSLVQSIKTTFVNVKNAIVAPFQQAFEWVKVQWLMQETFSDSFLNKLKSAVLSVWEPIKSGLVQAWNGIKTAASGVWEMIKNVILTPVLLLIDLVTGNFSKMGTDLSSIWNNIKNAASTIWSGLIQIFSGVWNALSGSATAFWNILSNGFTSLWNSIRLIATTVWNTLATFFTTTWNNMISGCKTLWNALPAFFTNLWNGIKAGITTAWKGFWTTINNFNITIKNGVINIWNSILDWFKSLPDTLKTIGSEMFAAMKNGVNSTINNVVTAIKNGIGTAINWIKDLPRQALQWGEDMINGFVDGIKNAAQSVEDAVSNVADDIRSVLHFSCPDEGPLADYETWMPDFMSGLAEGITNNISKVKNAVSQVASTMVNAVPTDLSLNIGASINGISGLKNAYNPSNLANQKIGNNSTPVNVEIKMGDITVQGYTSQDVIGKIKQAMANETKDIKDFMYDLSNIDIAAEQLANKNK